MRRPKRADVDRGAGPTLTGGAAQGNHPADRRRLALHSFRSLLRDLTTLMLNKTTVPANPNYTFNLLTKPTPLQARVFELLALSPLL